MYDSSGFSNLGVVFKSGSSYCHASMDGYCLQVSKESTKSIWDNLWSFPISVKDGDPDDFSMQFASKYQDRAENQFLRDKLWLLYGQLCVRTLQLEQAQATVEDLSARNEVLVNRVNAISSELMKYKTRLDLEDKIRRDVWTYAKTVDVGCNTDCLMITCTIGSIASNPLSLGQLLREDGVEYSSDDFREIARGVYESYVRVKGCAPQPVVYCDEDGNASRLGWYTEADRGLLRVILDSLRRDGLSSSL